MRLDYIEIGTSDFETIVEESNGFVEFHCADYDDNYLKINHLLSLVNNHI